MIIRKQNSNFVGGHFFCKMFYFQFFLFFFFKLPSKGKFCQIPFCCKVPVKTPLQPMVRIEFLWGYSPDSKHPVPVGKPKQNPPLKSSYKYYKEEILRYLLTMKINFLRSFCEISLHK